MNAEKKPNRTLPDRLLSMEGLLGLLGLFCLVSGLISGEVMPIFWGVLALGGLFVLHLVRKKDWQAHWQEMERERARQEERERRRKAGDN
jgi:uncharacterized membrane protein HdeD (DUF308 family)